MFLFTGGFGGGGVGFGRMADDRADLENKRRGNLSLLLLQNLQNVLPKKSSKIAQKLLRFSTVTLFNFVLNIRIFIRMQILENILRRTSRTIPLIKKDIRVVCPICKRHVLQTEYLLFVKKF